MCYRSLLLLFTVCFVGGQSFAQNEAELLRKVRAKLNSVNSYTANGRLKIDVPFIKAPESDVVVTFKKPDVFKVEKKDGISLLPKGGVSINLSTLLKDTNYTIVPAGEVTRNGTKLKVIKLIPLTPNSDLVLSTFYVDAAKEVIRRAEVTTRNSGSYDIDLQYGKYIRYALPDKVIFSFDAKEYKLPKGITFEYDKGEKRKEVPKDTKGRVELTYTSYRIA